MGLARDFSIWRLGCVVVVAMTLPLVAVGCGAGTQEAAANPHLSALGEAIQGTQRSAAAYTESVQVLVNNAAQDWCTGTVIAPYVVLTAAHCVAFNDQPGDGMTWTIIAPNAIGGMQTTTTAVGAGEVIDSAMWNAAGITRDNYYSYLDQMRDIGLVYLPQPFTGIAYPTFSNTEYGNTSHPNVSAIGRQAVARMAPLVLSGVVTVSGPALGYAFDNQTTRITDGGDSGGGLFLDGTHTLVGTESNFDDTGANQQDYWMRLDGGVYTFITGQIAAHGGAATTLASFRDNVTSALCNRVASCCAAQTAGYTIDETQCATIYNQLGFESTARGITIATAANVYFDETKAASCLTKVADGNSCTATSTDLMSAVTDCISAVNGRVAAGGACKASLECAGNAGCVKDAFGNGKCTSLASVGVGSNCQVLNITTTTEDQRDNLAQELCSKRGDGEADPSANNELYCNSWDFATNSYYPETSWTCAKPVATGSSCDTDQSCSSMVCDPSTYTCQSSIPFVNTNVCSAFKQ